MSGEALPGRRWRHDIGNSLFWVRKIRAGPPIPRGLPPGPIPRHSVRGSLGQIREIRVCRSNGGEIPNIKELRSVNMYSVNNTMNPVGGSLDRFD